MSIGRAVFREIEDEHCDPNYREEFPCWQCGKLVEVKYNEPKGRVFCDHCSDAHKQEHQALVAEYTKLKIRVMFETALVVMERSKKVFMHEYMDASKAIFEMAITQTEKFMSAHEMVTAIVLQEFGYDYEVNYPVVDRYRVDFYIPELNVCVEVDGNLHNYKLEYDSRRDIEIRSSLGEQWEVVRIPTKYIEQNPAKIPDAIEKIAEEKRRLRRKNLGILPDGYSKRENKHYESVLVSKKNRRGSQAGN